MRRAVTLLVAAALVAAGLLVEPQGGEAAIKVALKALGLT